MSPLHSIGWAAALLYGGAMVCLVVYALHSLWLLRLFRRHRATAATTEAAEEQQALPPAAELPLVLVQLPVFNERDVVERLLQAAIALDWPRERLRIQLLDDSTDDSVAIARQRIAELAAAGHPVEHLHRQDRVGFKAGALEAGMAASEAAYVAIFDADFVPRPDFLRRAIKPFLNDPDLALVQGRWEHHNRDANLLTRVQAIGIDGHFAVEQSARAWGGLAMNFNGTCGMWRRRAIEDAGGWQHDTLTEDLDLSYRAQMRGWRCTYRLGLDVPGELPADICAWRSQQFRWAKGSQQTARKLAGRIWGMDWPWHHKIAAFLHLTHYAVHPLMLLSLLAAPIALWLCPTPSMPILMAGLGAFLIGIFAPVLTYIASQLVLHERATAWRHLRVLPALASIGTGIAISNSRAVIEAWTGVVSPFVRTPKQGDSAGSYRASATTGVPELLCMVWALFGISLSVSAERPWVAPLLAIYASGFGWVGWLSLRAWFASRQREEPLSDRFFKRRWTTAAGVVGLGLLAATCYGALGFSGSTWQYAPGWFAAWGLAAGGIYLLASWLVQRRPGGRWALLWILLFGLVFRILSFNIAPSDDLNRYIVEGRQFAYGQNPYAVAPHDPAAQELLRPVLDNRIIDAVNHPEWTAIYPPLTIVAEMLITHIDSRVVAMNAANGLWEILAMAFIIAMLLRERAPPTLILLAWWNPIGPLWFAGEGHNDSLMVLGLCFALWLMQRGRRHSAAGALALATLAKPFVGWLFLDHSRRFGAAGPIIAAVVAGLFYLPFASAGMGLFGSLGRFGGEMHYHGALEPFIRLLWNGLLPSDAVRPAILITLAATLVCGTWLILSRRETGSSGTSPMVTGGRLLALLILCLPTCYPWYMLPIVACLPFLGGSLGLLLWTAMTPVFYLHGFAIIEERATGGEWAEWPIATALAHTPALLLLAWESIGRPGLPRQIEDAPLLPERA